MLEDKIIKSAVEDCAAFTQIEALNEIPFRSFKK
jgi:hypothetical protein